MRAFPSRSSRGSNNRDRMSLLAYSSSSPPVSPRKTFQSRLPSDVNGVHSSSSFDKQQPQRPSFGSSQKDTSDPVQFVPAYMEAMSPNASNSLDTTQPLSSPDHSFSLEQESNLFRSGSGTLLPKHPHSVVTPSPSATNQTRARPSCRSSDSRAVSTTKRSEEAASTATDSQRKGTSRIGRLASLFSSRAIVKNLDGKNQEQLCPSPPRSDSSSSGYVGWPGTQDKRGGTVAMEQSSYSDSEIGPQKNNSSSKSDSNSSAPEYNLAAAVVNATAAANSPLMKPQAEEEKVHRMAAPMSTQVRSLDAIYGEDHQNSSVKQLTDPWGNMNNCNEETMSEVSTKYSKTSSAYFKPKEERTVRPLEPRRMDRQAVAASVMRFQPGKPQPPTEEALRLKDHFTPPNRTYNATNAMGYRGLLDKTREVPNLMDGTESDSTHSSISGTNNYRGANGRKSRPRRIPPDPEDQILEEVSSDIFDGGGNRGRDGDSDVFDGVSNFDASSGGYLRRTPSIPENDQYAYSLGAVPRNDNEDLNVVLLGGGLTTIQTTANNFTNRVTASDFDENLSNSDYDQYGFARIPGFNEMATAGKRIHDQAAGGITTQFFSDYQRSSSQASSQVSSRAQEAIRRYKNRASSEASGSSAFSDQYEVDNRNESVRDSLMQYYVHPDEMKPLVKKFRKMSSRIAPQLNYDDMEREEDSTKAFALMEMRSRIMEKDIERGLERRGGTSVVDDLVLTPYNRTAMRVRDAIIVAKAWRDGATPQDIINTSLLTRRSERSYYIPRPANRRNTRWDNSRSPEHFTPQRYAWEEVCWLDDLELSQYRCSSIGPRHLRGFEMFTIGDCQSILLKLCNQQCEELRGNLNDATACQLEAEEEMKAEEACGDDGMMTETEMRYLTSMEEVKTVSHKLVLAEKAFTMVRDRIEKLVAKYEALLVKFDNDAESVAPSSVVTDASSYYSDHSATSFQQEKERETLARRAQRAELRAELAAREAMLTKQRAREERKEKEMEIQTLRQRLNDLQSESSAAIAEREHTTVLARAIAAGSRDSSPNRRQPSVPSVTTTKIEDVKQRFRNRSAGRANMNHPPRPNPASGRGVKSTSAVRKNYQGSNPRERNAMFRAVGEEMFQHLDFYERSLKAVEASG